MIRFAAICARCGRVLKFEAPSLNGAAKILKSHGWIRPQGVGSLCDQCAPQHRWNAPCDGMTTRIREIVTANPGMSTSEIRRIHSQSSPNGDSDGRAVYRNLRKLERSGRVYHVTDKHLTRWFPVGEAPC